MKQKTINKSISISGIGIHTGVETILNLVPDSVNSGIKFKRTDLEGQPIIMANVSNVNSTNRSTNLKKGDAVINTVEHILAAVVGAGIDNIIIEVNNSEVPILDGSAAEFAKMIAQVGTQEQDAPKHYYAIKKKLVFKDEVSGTEFVATPSEDYAITVNIDYNSKTLGLQTATLNNISSFNTEISSSRTFCFLHELEELLENNLIKGGDINNAIVIVEDDISKEKLDDLSKTFNKTNINVKEGGILNNLELHHNNEPARHKLLDVVGDLALLGKSIKGNITATKPGHKNNIEFAKYLTNVMIEDMKKTAPEIDFDTPPLYNKEKIKSILPHRDPFLFIDEIRDLGDDFIVGTKFVTADEDYFRGHFPGEPVMPGVLQLETMAQAGGVLILNTVENPEDYLTFFMKIDNAKFKRKVVPGDTLIFRLDLISPIRRGLCHMHGKGFVDGKLAVEADLLAQIAPKK